MLIGSTLRQATEEHVLKGIAGYGVALDLTLRDLQGQLKKPASRGRRLRVRQRLPGSPVLFPPPSSTATRRAPR